MVGCFSFLCRRGASSHSSQASVSHHRDEMMQIPRIHTQSPPPLLPAYSPPGQHAAIPPGFEAMELSGIMKDLSQSIESTVFALSGELRTLSLKMFKYKETAWQEKKTHDLFCNWFEDKFKSKGWKVTRHAAGLETAFAVEFEHVPKGHDGPVKTIGFNSELDALPGIGHACGHPLIAICGIAAAIATAEALVKHNLPGKVLLLGTPAEENGGGKCIMVERGAYKSMDVCLMAHPGPFSSTGSMLAVRSFTVSYTGQTAHAAGAPWEGINAMDAAVQAYNNIATLRQQVKPSHRMHGVIMGENLAANIIPDKVRFVFNARAPTKDELEELDGRVRKCFEAAALATGCKMDVKVTMTYLDLKNSSPLAKTYSNIMGEKYGDLPGTADAVGSTDFGDVTYALPALHPFFSIPLSSPTGGGNHTPAFEKDAQTDASHKKALEVAVALSLTGIKIVVDEDYAKEVRQDWDAWKKGERETP